MAISTGKPLGTGCVYGHPPIRLFGAESGDAAFLEVEVTGGGSCRQPCKSR